jgi:hypothetical protein
MTEPKSAEARKNGELSETSIKYVLEKVAERMTGQAVSFSNEATEHGVATEQMARINYEALSGLKVLDCGFIEVNEFLGGSPDGIIYDNDLKGIIEIKCPFNSAKHLEHCLIKTDDDFKYNFKAYYYQMQANMLFAEASFGDFISFDPRIDNDCGLFVYRLQKNADDQLAIMEQVDKAIKYLDKVYMEIAK